MARPNDVQMAFPNTGIAIEIDFAPFQTGGLR